MPFLPELSRNLQRKGGWEYQSTVVRKGSGDLPPPLFHYCALVFPSSLSLQIPREFKQKPHFFLPPLPGDTYTLIIGDSIN